MAIALSVVIQGGYISTYNIARNSDLGLILMYVLVALPIGVTGFLLSGASEAFRRQVLYKEYVAGGSA